MIIWACICLVLWWEKEERGVVCSREDEGIANKAITFVIYGIL